MEKYLIYQDKDQILRKKPITNMEQAEKIVKLYGGKTVKIDGEDAHIVGIGNDAVFRSHQIITDQQPTTNKLLCRTKKERRILQRVW